MKGLLNKIGLFTRQQMREEEANTEMWRNAHARLNNKYSDMTYVAKEAEKRAQQNIRMHLDHIRCTQSATSYRTYGIEENVGYFAVFMKAENGGRSVEVTVKPFPFTPGDHDELDYARRCAEELLEYLNSKM